MKIRQGFVSNSSTTSFCIYGTCFEGTPFTKDVIIKWKTNYPEDFNAFITANEKKSWAKDGIEILKNIDNTDSDNDVHSLTDLLSEGLPNNLEVHPYYDAGAYYIGRSWSTIKDDETGGQFKQSIKTALEKMFGPDIKCETHAEAWRDG